MATKKHKIERKVFRSRISVMIIVFFIAFYVILFPSLQLFQDKFYGILFMIWIPLLGIHMFIFFGFRYIISGNILYFKAGFISLGNVRIDDIILVERTYFTTPYPLASMFYFVAPSASLTFLCINYKREQSNLRKPNFWLISPVREQEFIDELKSINSDIYVHVPVKKGIWRFWDWDI